MVNGFWTMEICNLTAAVSSRLRTAAARLACQETARLWVIGMAQAKPKSASSETARGFSTTGTSSGTAAATSQFRIGAALSDFLATFRSSGSGAHSSSPTDLASASHGQSIMFSYPCGARTWRTTSSLGRSFPNRLLKWLPVPRGCKNKMDTKENGDARTEPEPGRVPLAAIRAASNSKNDGDETH